MHLARLPTSQIFGRWLQAKMRTYYIILLFLLTSCKSSKEYFYFDEIIHYRMNISNNNLFELEQIKNKTKIDSFLLKFTYEDEPKNINDTEFFSNLNSKYFKRTIIDNSKLIKFRDIFKEKYHFKTSETACEPIFRDIFIFRKKNKLIGIAKICFECKKCYILGTNANTNEFGQSGDYNKLKNLVKN